MTVTGLVVLVDLTSWEAWVHLGGALRARGFEVVRLTGRQVSSAQRLRVGLERVVFDKTLPVLVPDAVGPLDVTALFPWLHRALDVQMVDAVGAVVTETPEWRAHPHLRRVTSDGLADPDIYDKWTYTQVAARTGIPIPHSIRLPELLPSGDWVLKGRTGSGGDRVKRVATTSEAVSTLEEWNLEPSRVFLQAPVSGELWNVGGVALRGEVLEAAAYRARSAPDDPEGPPIDIRLGQRPEQLEATRDFIAALGYTGPFAIDFIDDGTPYLIDFNARFFGTWAAMQSAGVDLIGAYLGTLGGSWTGSRYTVETSWLPSSTAGRRGFADSWHRTRQLGTRLYPVIGARATAVATIEGLANTAPGAGRGTKPRVALAYSEPWLAGLQWGAALKRQGVEVVRFTVAPMTALQRVRQAGESLCFNQTVRLLTDDGRRIRVLDPERLVSGFLDVQMTDRVLEAMLESPQWRRSEDLHHVGTGVDPSLLCNKHALMTWAAGHGLPVASSWAVAEIPNSWPVIVKPVTGYGGIGVRKCRDQVELDDALVSMPGVEVLIEEFLPGPQVNVGGVALQGEILVAAAYTPLSAREDPFGPSVAIRVVDSSDAMGLAAELIAALSYSGPFCLDTLMAHGTLRMVDFNARVFGPWAGLQRAGLDIIGAYLHALGVGGNPSPTRPSPGTQVVVDMDPASPARVGVRDLLVETRPLVGFGGLVGQAAQLVAKRVHS